MRHWKIATIVVVAVLALTAMWATTGFVLGSSHWPFSCGTDGNSIGAQVTSDSGSSQQAVIDPDKITQLIDRCAQQGIITTQQANDIKTWWNNRPQTLNITSDDLSQIQEWLNDAPASAGTMFMDPDIQMVSPDVLKGAFDPKTGGHKMKQMCAGPVQAGVITQADSDDIVAWWNQRPAKLKITQAQMDQVTDWWNQRPAALMELIMRGHVRVVWNAIDIFTQGNPQLRQQAGQMGIMLLEKIFDTHIKGSVTAISDGTLTVKDQKGKTFNLVIGDGTFVVIQGGTGLKTGDAVDVWGWMNVSGDITVKTVIHMAS